jgi:hypothetical protein
LRLKSKSIQKTKWQKDMRLILPFITLIFFLTACDKAANPIAKTTKEEICGRDNGISPFVRKNIYRAQVPADWRRQIPHSQESIADTTKSLCEYIIFSETGGQIRITIHNFPMEQSDRIPPSAQITRWKRQFSKLDPMSVFIIPQSFGGFAGVLFEASGEMDNIEQTVLAWAMQLGPEHYSTLSMKINLHPEQAEYLKQMRADYTIKAKGPKDLIEKHKKSIQTFAHSFELIEEIPIST